jgi:glutamine synthetase
MLRSQHIFRAAGRLSTQRPLSTLVSKGFGQHLFRGAVAAPYLQNAGLPADVLDSSAWTQDGSADRVAAAILAWAQDNGASVYCHQFQPLGSSGFRHGLTAQVHTTMVEFDRDGSPQWNFKGKHLLRGGYARDCASALARATYRA